MTQAEKDNLNRDFVKGILNSLSGKKLISNSEKERIDGQVIKTEKS